MAQPRAASTVRKTPHFDFLFGKYSHSSIKVPYFQVSMTFGDAANYLKLVGEMPGAASVDWKIEELFQRDIDWSRVERKIVPYLRQEQQPQFFNSLTIALLPFRDEAIHPFAGQAWRAPRLDEENDFPAARSFGPIRCGYWQEWEDSAEDAARIGQLAWNTDEICGIAIDGQHRLAAIKQVILGGADAYRNCAVPVILVVLDPALGYTGAQDRPGMIETLRSLFIDLNKHAKNPSRARQILLDDRDPASICVRALVGEKLKRGHAEISETPPRIPLSLIDWHSEQAKFHAGPYLTTVLGLDWVVAKLLRIKPMQDMMAFDAISKNIETLERQLGIDLSPAAKRLDDCRRYERPFAFVDEPTSELDQMAAGFQNIWCAPVVYLLTKLAPYQELIVRRDNLETLSPEFANWCALKQRADDVRGSSAAANLLTEYERSLANRTENPIAIADFQDAFEQLEAMKVERELAFTVVFQRAVILAYAMFVKVSNGMLPDSGEVLDEDIDDLLESDEVQSEEPVATDSRLERARQLVDALNFVIAREPGLLHKDCEFTWPKSKSHDRFWIGSLVQMEGPIDFSQAASTRASDILLLIALLWLYRTIDGVSSFKDLVDRVERADGGMDLKLRQCLGRLQDGDNSVAARILKARDEDDSPEDKAREVLGRAEWLWSILGSRRSV